MRVKSEDEWASAAPAAAVRGRSKSRSAAAGSSSSSSWRQFGSRRPTQGEAFERRQVETYERRDAFERRSQQDS